MDKNVKLTLEIPKIPDIETIAIIALDRLGVYWGIQEDKLSEARIILSEAIINALEHSGAENPVAKVSFELTRETLSIKVRDFGSGFNPSDIERPNIDEKIHAKRKRGWGLTLMRSMSDDFVIKSTKRGTFITMIKKL